MANVESLGIKRLEALHYYVHDLDRSRRFYGDMLDLPMVARSVPELDAKSQQTSEVFDTGELSIVVSAPTGEGGRASRFLKNHPDGIGTLVFEVEDIQRTFDLLDARGGTPIQEIVRESDDGGEIAYFSITTPLGDTTFRFVQRKGFSAMFPGLTAITGASEKNRFGLRAADHITSNFQTMSPALLWFEHVMGFERYWNVEFHTTDVTPDMQGGSGLRSVVMRDPVSGVKFANNEPRRPSFTASQINLFNRDHRGDGVQHIALACDDLIGTVSAMRERGVEFMHTPDAYYEAMKDHLTKRGVGDIDESVEALKSRGILVDGAKPGQYMLQIFLKDSQALYGDPVAGPFFYELIQRKGDLGFGEGNFRALFESIERDQTDRGAA